VTEKKAVGQIGYGFGPRSGASRDYSTSQANTVSDEFLALCNCEDGALSATKILCKVIMKGSLDERSNRQGLRHTIYREVNPHTKEKFNFQLSQIPVLQEAGSMLSCGCSIL
jgi:hypothetical protein